MKPGSVIVDLAVGAGRQRRRLASRARSSSSNGVKIIGTTEPAGAGRRPTPRRCTRATCSTSSRCRSTSKTGELEARARRRDRRRRRWSCDAGRSVDAGERDAGNRLHGAQRAHDRHGRRSHRLQPDHLRAGDLRRLPRGVDRDAGAAHAAHVGDQRDLGDHPGRRDAGRRARGVRLGRLGRRARGGAWRAINAFGGFLVTQRMLEMFKKKEPKAPRLPRRSKH